MALIERRNTELRAENRSENYKMNIWIVRVDQNLYIGCIEKLRKGLETTERMSAVQRNSACNLAINVSGPTSCNICWCAKAILHARHTRWYEWLEPQIPIWAVCNSRKKKFKRFHIQSSYKPRLFAPCFAWKHVQHSFSASASASGFFNDLKSAPVRVVCCYRSQRCQNLPSCKDGTILRSSLQSSYPSVSKSSQIV